MLNYMSKEELKEQKVIEETILNFVKNEVNEDLIYIKDFVYSLVLSSQGKNNYNVYCIRFFYEDEEGYPNVKSEILVMMDMNSFGILDYHRNNFLEF